MLLRKSCIAVLAVFLLLPLTAQAAEKQDQTKIRGEFLVRAFWSMVKNGDRAALTKLLAPGFQSLHVDGPRSLAQEMDLLMKVNIGPYRLSDFRTTRVGDALVVTYRVSVDETIKGQRLKGRAAPRMSVFVKTPAGWRMAAHANPISLK